MKFIINKLKIIYKGLEVLIIHYFKYFYIINVKR